MSKVRIEFELAEPTTEFRKFTKDSGKLVMTLRSVLDNEDAEALAWLSDNVLDMKVKP